MDNELVLKKQLHKHGNYLTVSLSEEDCKKLDLKEGDRIQLEKIIEMTWEQFLTFRRWLPRQNAYNLHLNKRLLDAARVVYSCQ